MSVPVYGFVLGINPHVKDMTARKLLVRNLAVLLLKKGCATNECRKETSGTAREQNPRRNFQANLELPNLLYAMYERDERVPRDEVKVRISNFFGVSVQELFFN